MDAAGIAMGLKPIEQSVQINTALGNDWQAQLWRNHPGGDPDLQYNWWKGGSPINFNKFNDAEINELLDRDARTDDPDDRQGSTRTINREFAKRALQRVAQLVELDRRYRDRCTRHLRSSAARRRGAAPQPRDRTPGERHVDPAVTAHAPLELTVDPHDVLALDGLLSDEERMLRDTVRRLVVDRILPEVGGWFDRGVFPVEMAKEFGALGLLGMHLEGYGCAGTSATAYGLACLELEAGDSGARSFVSVQGSLAMYPIHAFGSEEQRQQWLPAMAAGTAIGCFGLTEPDSGSDPSSMRTTARKVVGGDWILNGSKMWITNGSVADVAIVWATTDPDGPDAGAVRGFVVPAGTAGFSAPEIHRKVSLRASVTSELIMDEVRLPADAVLPGVSGMRGPLSCLNEARYGISFGACGAARACYESALAYSLEREQFDRPIALVPAHPGEARRHDGRRAAGDDGGAAPGAVEGCRNARDASGQLRKDGQRADGAGRGSTGPVGAGSKRHHDRVPGDPPHDQSRISVHLRGHERDPHTHPGQCDHGHPGLRIGPPDRLVLRFRQCPTLPLRPIPIPMRRRRRRSQRSCAPNGSRGTQHRGRSVADAGALRACSASACSPAYRHSLPVPWDCRGPRYPGVGGRKMAIAGLITGALGCAWSMIWLMTSLL